MWVSHMIPGVTGPGFSSSGPSIPLSLSAYLSSWFECPLKSDTSKLQFPLYEITLLFELCILLLALKTSLTQAPCWMVSLQKGLWEGRALSLLNELAMWPFSMPFISLGFNFFISSMRGCTSHSLTILLALTFRFYSPQRVAEALANSAIHLLICPPRQSCHCLCLTPHCGLWAPGRLPLPEGLRGQRWFQGFENL